MRCDNCNRAMIPRGMYESINGRELCERVGCRHLEYRIGDFSRRVNR